MHQIYESNGRWTYASNVTTLCCLLSHCMALPSFMSLFVILFLVVHISFLLPVYSVLTFCPHLKVLPLRVRLIILLFIAFPLLVLFLLLGVPLRLLCHYQLFMFIIKDNMQMCLCMKAILLRVLLKL